MQGSEEIESKLSKMVHDLGDESAYADLETILEGLKERDRRIDETLEELLEEVDRLILLADEIEKSADCDG